MLAQYIILGSGAAILGKCFFFISRVGDGCNFVHCLLVETCSQAMSSAVPPSDN